MMTRFTIALATLSLLGSALAQEAAETRRGSNRTARHVRRDESEAERQSRRLEEYDPALTLYTTDDNRELVITGGQPGSIGYLVAGETETFMDIGSGARLLVMPLHSMVLGVFDGQSRLTFPLRDRDFPDAQGYIFQAVGFSADGLPVTSGLMSIEGPGRGEVDPPRQDTNPVPAALPKTRVRALLGDRGHALEVRLAAPAGELSVDSVTQDEAGNWNVKLTASEPSVVEPGSATAGAQFTFIPLEGASGCQFVQVELSGRTASASSLVEPVHVPFALLKTICVDSDEDTE